MVVPIIGIDVSKATLDLFCASTNTSTQIPNDPKSIKAWLKTLDQSSHFVFEATGRYHRQLEKLLASGNRTYFKVNPWQARRFAESTGKRAKTDKVDAKLLAKMAGAITLKLGQLPDQTIDNLKQILLVREGLIKEQTAEKNRSLDLELKALERLSQKRLKRLSQDLEELEALIKTTIESDAELLHRFTLLISIKGMGTISAATLIAHMPELGDINGSKIASLAGLAPIVRQSGTWSGKTRIGGGRAIVRHALYMPAVSASRFNSDLKEFYQRLRNAGKPHKVSITAVMRKLLIIANTLIAQNREFRP